MQNLYSLMIPRRVNLNTLLLDPNNPRFAELGEPVDVVPEIRFSEDRVQRDTFERMKSGNFEVTELRDTIKTLGFLPMDRIVVRPWHGNPDAQKFVVIEGNRRISALKWLIELHETGRETFDDEQIINFTDLEVLVLDDNQAPDSAKWILPGLRHVSGIKEWGAYQKARTVHVLREAGVGPQEAGQSLGLSTRTANQLWRSYLALEQMQADDEFSEYAIPRKYSYFEEVFKRANVREWLSWSDNERRFTNASHLREFYSWMVGEPDDDGELGDPKLPEAKSVRSLGIFIDDEVAMALFRSQGGTIERALGRFEAEHQEDWQPTIIQAQAVLATLSPDSLRSLSEEDIAALTSLKNRIERVFEDRIRLIGE
ncbi:MAG: hypothetical protein V1799_04070 [bacterium]